MATIKNTGTRIRHLPGRGTAEIPGPFMLAPGESAEVPDEWVKEFAVGSETTPGPTPVKKLKPVAAMIARGALSLSPMPAAAPEAPAGPAPVTMPPITPAPSHATSHGKRSKG